MNFRSRIRREEPEINLIPMIDLLLVILIFLMVSTTYARLTELQVSLPSASPEAAPRKTKEIVVTVSRDGRYLIGSTPQDFGSASRFASRLLDAAGAEKDPTVVIQADAAANHQAVVNVLEAARLAGLGKVSFATQSGAARKP